VSRAENTRRTADLNRNSSCQSFIRAGCEGRLCLSPRRWMRRARNSLNDRQLTTKPQATTVFSASSRILVQFTVVFTSPVVCRMYCTLPRMPLQRCPCFRLFIHLFGGFIETKLRRIAFSRHSSRIGRPCAPCKAVIYLQTGYRRTQVTNPAILLQR
jgi:hypothetical protein